MIVKRVLDVQPGDSYSGKLIIGVEPLPGVVCLHFSDRDSLAFCNTATLLVEPREAE